MCGLCRETNTKVSDPYEGLTTPYGEVIMNERAWEALNFKVEILEQRLEAMNAFLTQVAQHCALIGDAFILNKWREHPSVEDYLELEEHIRGKL